MTDGSTPDQPPQDPADGAGSNMISEDELDQILAQASSLAADLSQEVGPAETPRLAHSVTDAGADLDAELSELERLVAETAGEVNDGPSPPDQAGAASTATATPSPGAAAAGGSAPAAAGESVATPPGFEPGASGGGTTPGDADGPPEAAAPSDTKPPASSKPPPVPDFMAEFTHPEEGTSDVSATSKVAPSAAASKPAPAQKPPAPVSLPKPGVVSSGRSTAAAASIPSLDDGGPDGKPPPEGESAAPGPATEGAAEVTGPADGTTGGVSAIVLAVCDKGVSILEAIDRPFAGLGRLPRRLIGLLAIATAGTAVIALLLSLF